jgi:hypothetical protein
MDTTHYKKAAICMVIIVLAVVATWEIYLRNRGIRPDYNNDETLFAHSRAMVYEPADKATVFIGSSRIKFDIDLPTWQEVTGEHAIQLGYEASSPWPLLEDLSNDTNFRGKLVVDLTENPAFTVNPRRNLRPMDGLKYYRDQTPSQQFSFNINRPLESQLVFLDKENLSLTAFLDKLNVPNRKGVVNKIIFPLDFRRVSFDRQSRMTDHFLSDTALQNQTKRNWGNLSGAPRDKKLAGAGLDSMLNKVKSWVDKIKGRGGQIVFVRPPCSDPFLQFEERNYPRAQYWDRVLTVTGCEGVNFMDYPAQTHFTCPEWSHLSPKDAAIYTKDLALVIQQDKGWTFPKKVSP